MSGGIPFIYYYKWSFSLVKKDKTNIPSSPELIIIAWSMDMLAQKHCSNDTLTDKVLLKLSETVI